MFKSHIIVTECLQGKNYYLCFKDGEDEYEESKTTQ